MCVCIHNEIYIIIFVICTSMSSSFFLVVPCLCQSSFFTFFLCFYFFLLVLLLLCLLKNMKMKMPQRDELDDSFSFLFVPFLFLQSEKELFFHACCLLVLWIMLMNCESSHFLFVFKLIGAARSDSHLVHLFICLFVEHNVWLSEECFLKLQKYITTFFVNPQLLHHSDEECLK